MSQQSTPKKTKQKIAFIVFVKGSIAPIVLYLDEPVKVYENVQRIIESTNAPKMFEIEANGPIKKVTLVTSEITGCALQEEFHFGNR